MPVYFKGKTMAMKMRWTIHLAGRESPGAAIMPHWDLLRGWGGMCPAPHPCPPPPPPTSLSLWIYVQGGLHERALGSDSHSWARLTWWQCGLKFSCLLLDSRYGQLNDLGWRMAKKQKESYFELGRRVLVSVNPLSNSTVFVGESLQKIIVNVKPYPQTEQGDIVSYALLHVFLNFWQF